jgi:metal-responsive CopG/Arc/MetJ family transcriptional regulator
MSKTAERIPKSAMRVSIPLAPDLYAQINERAKEHNLSLSRVLVQLLRAGLQAEHDKKQRLGEMLHRYRECTDPQEAERLGNELGAMIFGR